MIEQHLPILLIAIPLVCAPVCVLPVENPDVWVYQEEINHEK